MHEGFHTHDGWYFKRLPDGSVRIVVTESSHVDAPVLREHVLPENEWASVVTSVSALGENYERWQAARTFHSLPEPTTEMVTNDGTRPHTASTACKNLGCRPAPKANP